MPRTTAAANAAAMPEPHQSTLIDIEDALNDVRTYLFLLRLAADGLTDRQEQRAVSALADLLQEQTTAARDMVAKLRTPEGSDETEQDQ